MEILAQQESVASDDTKASAERTLSLFRALLVREIEEARTKPRESSLAWPTERIAQVEATVIQAAHSFWESRRRPQNASSARDEGINRAPVVELSIRSKDGSLCGTIDHADRRPEGWRIIDYKTTVDPNAEHVAEHSVQIRLYAYLWKDWTGEWPTTGTIVYLVGGNAHSVSVSPDECTAVAEEIKRYANFSQDQPPESLANVGTACKMCEFRPWCEPFWTHRAHPEPLGDESPAPSSGIEGYVTEHRQVGDSCLAELSTGSSSVELRYASSRFPHLSRLTTGQRLRILDVRIRGSASRFACIVTDRTEIYRVEDRLKLRRPDG